MAVLVTNNCVRYARKNVKTGLPGHEFILAKETSAMFGPARNSDGALNYVESRQPLTKEKTPPPLAYDIQNVRNLSTIRELDSILTFPMRKTIDEARELSLISDGIQAGNTNTYFRRCDYIRQENVFAKCQQNIGKNASSRSPSYVGPVEAENDRRTWRRRVSNLAKR